MVKKRLIDPATIEQVRTDPEKVFIIADDLCQWVSRHVKTANILELIHIENLIQKTIVGFEIIIKDKNVMDHVKRLSKHHRAQLYLRITQLNEELEARRKAFNQRKKS